MHIRIWMNPLSKEGEGNLANSKIIDKIPKHGIDFLLNRLGRIDNFGQILYLLPKKCLFRKRVALNTLNKLTGQSKWGWGNVDMADKGRRGVGEMLSLADKGGVWNPHFWLT